MPEFQAVAVYKEDYKKLVEVKLKTRQPIYYIIKLALDKWLKENKVKNLLLVLGFTVLLTGVALAQCTPQCKTDPYTGQTSCMNTCAPDVQ